MSDARGGRVHLKRGNGYVCGVGHRWSSQDISSTRTAAGVTCESCLRAIRKSESAGDTPEPRTIYEPCVLNAAGDCTRWSHDHSARRGAGDTPEEG